MNGHRLLARHLVSACLAATLMSASTLAVAEDSCSCSKQTDGTTFCVCVDDNGHQYCKSCPANGGACSTVPCN